MTNPMPAACRLACACQLGSVALLGWRFAAHLPFAMLLQTLAFVALNKVGAREQRIHMASCAHLNGNAVKFLYAEHK